MVAVLVVIAATLIHKPTWAHLEQDVDQGTRRRRDTKDIRITVKKYEYVPAVITVKQVIASGRSSRRSITTTDSRSRPFISIKLVKKGESRSIEFNADMTGSFNVVPGMCIEFIRGCLWFVGILYVFCRSLSAFKN